MNRNEKISLILGVIAVVLAVIAFVFSSAPFTPAIALLYIVAPLVMISAILGAWRLSLLAIYFSVVAWISSPLSSWLTFRVDYFLIFSGIFGVLLALGLYLHYRHRAKIT